MSNEVWVSWKDPATGNADCDIVDNLNDNAKVANLRKSFIRDRGLGIDSAKVFVSEKHGGAALRADEPLRKYFVPSPSAAASAGPGRSIETPLFITWATITGLNQPGYPAASRVGLKDGFHGEEVRFNGVASCRSITAFL